MGPPAIRHGDERHPNDGELIEVTSPAEFATAAARAIVNDFLSAEPPVLSPTAV
ncbi:MAG: hypothetical protein AAF420_03465 [Pseudomonadota bacterium]